MSNNRANQIIVQLDQLTAELKELANNPSAVSVVEHLRTTMGFEKGGYVGQRDIGELLDAGDFDAYEEDDDE